MGILAMHIAFLLQINTIFLVKESIAANLLYCIQTNKPCNIWLYSTVNPR